MTKDRRWLKSILDASKDKRVALPFERGNRRRPAAFKPSETQHTQQRAAAN